MKKKLDFIGVGIGPFHLSLASLMSSHPELSMKFFEQKPQFSWHSEIMFKDSVMQTSYLKDLVTPIDPTNRNSFLNYLVQKGLFYAHMNTGRNQVTRREFELYCQWVSENLSKDLSFNTPVQDIHFENGHFVVNAGNEDYEAHSLSIATGATPWVPEFASNLLSKRCFHAKSKELSLADLKDKRVVVVGGGQTGLEVFRNSLQGKWGRPASVTMLSRRHTLEPLDESPFTNEYFTPTYVEDFYKINNEVKKEVVHHQRFASDGNTPFYLQEFYNELYLLRHVHQDPMPVNILPLRKVFSIEKQDEVYRVSAQNLFTSENEGHECDVVIFCTGLKQQIPKCLSNISHLINFDEQNRFKIDHNFAVDWKYKKSNNLYALNFGRHIHGIAEPQTSLMAWRSGTIINHLMNKETYPTVHSVKNFSQHGALS